MNLIYNLMSEELNDDIEMTLYNYLRWGGFLRLNLFLEYKEAGRTNANTVYNSMRIEL